MDFEEVDLVRRQIEHIADLMFAEGLRDTYCYKCYREVSAHLRHLQVCDFCREFYTMLGAQNGHPATPKEDCPKWT